MANLKISEKWNAGIYQLETTDPVMGGEDGIDNVQARQLAENIFYMRQRGIADWNGDLNYIKNSFVLYDNKLYQSTVDNNKNKQPSESSKEWSLFLQTASTSAPGLIQLSSAINSTSETTAATSKAVKEAYDKAFSANAAASTAKSTAETDATTSVKGRVQLSSSTSSISETTAATSKAVKTAYDKAFSANEAASTAKSTAETDATTLVKGRVQLSSSTSSISETTAATSKAVKTAYDKAFSANEAASTAKSTAETDATTSVKGRVQLSSSTSSASETTAATSKAVKEAYDKAVNAEKLTNQVHIVESYLSSDGLSGYRKWSDKRIEQWGYFKNDKTAQTLITTNLLAKFSNDKYLLLLTVHRNEGASTLVQKEAGYRAKTESYFTKYTAAMGYEIGFGWYASGY